MSNSILTPTAVTNEALRILHQKLNFVGSIERQYDDSFAKTGGKIGSDLKIRLPNQYTVRTGAALQAQDTTETSTTLSVATQKGVDLNFTSVDLTLSLDDFSKRILEPSMTVLAAAIEADALSMHKSVWRAVWNSGSATSLANILSGRKIMTDELAPLDNRTALMSTQQMVDVVSSGSALFNQQTELGNQYKEGYVGRFGGYDFAENTLIPQFARGALDGSWVVNTSSGITSGSSSITLSGGGGATSNVGDIFTIVGVNRVHPETKVDTGVLQQFVVVTAGTTTQVVSPTPVTSGATQNVIINSAGASKAVVWAGTASGSDDTSLLYHKEAFAIAFADLQMPDGVDFAKRVVQDGISMRIVRQYDINSDKFPCRLDVLYGYKAIRPQLAVRIHNN